MIYNIIIVIIDYFEQKNDKYLEIIFDNIVY